MEQQKNHPFCFENPVAHYSLAKGAFGPISHLQVKVGPRKAVGLGFVIVENDPQKGAPWVLGGHIDDDLKDRLQRCAILVAGAMRGVFTASTIHFIWTPSYKDSCFAFFHHLNQAGAVCPSAVFHEGKRRLMVNLANGKIGTEKQSMQKVVLCPGLQQATAWHLHGDRRGADKDMFYFSELRAASHPIFEGDKAEVPLRMAINLGRMSDRAARLEIVTPSFRG